DGTITAPPGDFSDVAAIIQSSLRRIASGEPTLTSLCSDPRAAAVCGLSALSFFRHTEGLLAIAFLGDAGMAVASPGGRVPLMSRDRGPSTVVLPVILPPQWFSPFFPDGVGRVNCLAGGKPGHEWCVAAGFATGQVILWWLSPDVESLPLKPHDAAVLAVAVLT